MAEKKVKKTIKLQDLKPKKDVKAGFQSNVGANVGTNVSTHNLSAHGPHQHGSHGH